MVLIDSINGSQHIDSCNSIPQFIGFNKSLEAALEIYVWGSLIRYMEINVNQLRRQKKDILGTHRYA